ncbi:hypothetical protein SAMN05428949_5886 [Chitinophaga sp. YR627]|uniref:hypothetical protein n=1 Tax=Chitinophaga sp. YR627 TaxID=1881041 RepID=UPI0008EF32CF|nr:hypothetical protein [Chitinophaga sp. YR627]SFO58672.1 hypothetical protein SAMN05428949_5886 [Chitinophaga sp. YR627]
MKKFLCATILFLSCTIITVGQTKEISEEINKQRSANSKDVLTSFFRASIDNLLGSDRSFTFNSSLYGIDSIFRRRGVPPHSYGTEKRLRGTSVNLNIAGDSANNITRYGGGLSVTILNKKDVMLTKMATADQTKLQQLSFFMSAFKRSIKNVITQHHAGFFDDTTLNKAVTASLKAADAANDYTNVHPLIAEAMNDPAFITDIIAQKNASFTMDETEITTYVGRIKRGEDAFQTVYSDIAENYRQKPLWTATGNVSYDRVDKQAEYEFSTYFIRGIGNTIGRRPWELEANASFKIGRDSSFKGSNYNNKLFSASLGVNKILLQDEQKVSKMEFKLFTQYDRQLGDVPPDTPDHLFTFNSTIRINVFKSLWLPLTLRYDPENSNFLGMFAITANIGN